MSTGHRVLVLGQITRTSCEYRASFRSGRVFPLLSCHTSTSVPEHGPRHMPDSAYHIPRHTAAPVCHARRLIADFVSRSYARRHAYPHRSLSSPAQ
eukprot:1445380-Rhodomonas_salina.1